MSRGPRFVLDTHAALWAQLDVKRLGRNARTALTGLPPSALAVCDVTLAETCAAATRGPDCARDRRARSVAGCIWAVFCRVARDDAGGLDGGSV